MFKSLQGKLAFGVVPKDTLNKMKSKCGKVYPRANKFQPEPSKASSAPVATGNQSNNNSTKTEPILCNGKNEMNHAGGGETTTTATHTAKLPNGFVNVTSALIEDHCSHGV